MKAFTYMYTTREGQCRHTIIIELPYASLREDQRVKVHQLNTPTVAAAIAVAAARRSLLSLNLIIGIKQTVGVAYSIYIYSLQL